MPYAEHCASCTCRDHLSDDELAEDETATPARVLTPMAPRMALPRSGPERRRPLAIRRRLAHLLLDLCCLAFLIEGVLAFDDTMTQFVIAQAWSPGHTAFASAVFATAAIAVVFLVVTRALRVTWEAER